MTHTSRPARGRARDAWDYFAAQFPSRPIAALYYSPNCNGARAWICELAIRDADMDHCDTYNDWWVKTVLIGALDHWKRSTPAADEARRPP